MLSAVAVHSFAARVPPGRRQPQPASLVWLSMRVCLYVRLLVWLDAGIACLCTVSVSCLGLVMMCWS